MQTQSRKTDTAPDQEWCVCITSSEKSVIHVKRDSLLGQKNMQDLSMAELSGTLLMIMVISTT